MKPKIIKDSREQQGWQFEEDDTFGGMVIAKLDTGDYSIEGAENFITIERKGKLTEYASNLTQERFVSELERMQTIPHRFLLLEFTVRDLLNYPLGAGIPSFAKDKIKVTGDFLLRRTLEYQMKYGINIWFCNTARESEIVAKSILKRAWNEYNKT